MASEPKRQQVSVLVDEDRADDRNLQVVCEIEQPDTLSHPRSPCQRFGERIAFEQRLRDPRPWNLPVPPDAGGVPFHQLEQGVHHCLFGRAPGGASVAVAAPCTGRVASEADLRGQPMRRSIRQSPDRAPVDLAVERRRLRDRVIAVPRAVEVEAAVALFRCEAEVIPGIKRPFAQRTPIAPPAAVTRPVKPGLKLGKLPEA